MTGIFLLVVAAFVVVGVAVEILECGRCGRLRRDHGPERCQWVDE